MWFSVRIPLITLWPFQEVDQKNTRLPVEQLTYSAQIPRGGGRGEREKRCIYSMLLFCSRTVPQNSIFLLTGFNPLHLKLGYQFQRGENPHSP